MGESYAGNYLTDNDALSVYNDKPGATTATVKIDGNTLTLTLDGSPTALDLTETGKDTLGELVTAINAIGNNWTATLLGPSNRASRDLMVDKAETSCLGSENIQTLKTIEQEVTNWPNDWEEIQKRELIQEKEALVERITKDYFYSKAFSIKRNGNGKNQLFLGLSSNILTITKIKIFGIELDTSWYTYDERSAYIDLATWGGTFDWGEYKYRLKWVEEEGIFSRGINSVEIEGTLGWTSCPKDLRRAIVMMIMDVFDKTLYDHWIKGSESIGKDYRYSNPNKVYTGIVEVDTILSRYIRKRPIMATTT